MPRRIAVGTLDILNVIRQNDSYEYQSQVPVITQATDIPKVGAVIYGTPALANQFLEDLKQAFLPIEGVQDLIAKIVDSVYTAAEVGRCDRHPE